MPYEFFSVGIVFTIISMPKNWEQLPRSRHMYGNSTIKQVSRDAICRFPDENCAGNDLKDVLTSLTKMFHMINSY